MLQDGREEVKLVEFLKTELIIFRGKGNMIIDIGGWTK
jgi:hypothetical protein